MLISFGTVLLYLVLKISYGQAEEASNLCAQKPYLVFCRSTPSQPNKDNSENDKAEETTEKTSAERNDTSGEQLPASVSRAVAHSKNEDIDAHLRKHYPQPSATARGKECATNALAKRFIRKDPEYYEYLARRARLLKRLKALDAEATSHNTHSTANYYSTGQSQSAYPQQYHQSSSSYYGDCSPYYPYYGSSGYGYSSGYYYLLTLAIPILF
uniref:Uncharacterized protein n=1 Tax=Ditylenchus dipsaci TaxID=166011 RepID=A0A915D545_9BILA